MGTTAEKLEYLNTTKQLIKESINLTDANITTEPFRQYATILKHRLPEIVGDPSIIWNNYDHVTGTGTSFSISAYDSIIDYSLKGDTTQNGTPTPTAPIPINTVTGNQVISVSDGTNTKSFDINLGKNLYGGFTFSKTGNGITFNYYEDGTITAQGIATASTTSMSSSEARNNNFLITLSSGTYTISGGLPNVAIEVINNSGGYIAGTNSSTTFTVNSETQAFVRLNVPNGTNLSNGVVLKSMIEKGEEVTSYAPYFTPIELCKIGDYQDKIYKENGKWYLYKEITKKVFNGSEGWIYQGTDGNTAQFRLNTSIDAKATGSDNITGYVTHFTGNTSGASATSPCWWFNGSGYIRFRTDTSTASNLNNFNTWLASVTPIAYYPLNTPTTEEIKNYDLLNQLNALSLYTGNNNITVSGDLPALLDLTALKYN